MQEEILKRLDLLAAKLGILAGQLWQFYLIQAKVDGWLDLGTGCLLLIVAGVAVFVANWGNKSIEAHKAGGRPSYSYPDIWDVAFIGGIILAAILSVISVYVFRSGIVNIFNPGYAAFHNLIADLAAK